MKHIGKLAVLGAVLAASASFAFADTLTLASYGTAGNSITNPTETISNGATTIAGFSTSVTTPTSTGITTGTAFDLNPGTTWIAPLGNTAGHTTTPTSGPNSVWVGAYASAGPGGSPPATGYYTFTTTITGVAGGTYSGNLDVLADDTVAVYLNGILTPIINFGNIGGDTHCAVGVPNCAGEDNVTFSNLALTAGTDTLEFVVEQTANPSGPGGNQSSGVDFDGSLSQNTPSPTPEPSSLMLLGSGLVGAAGMFFRRRVTA